MQAILSHRAERTPETVAVSAAYRRRPGTTRDGVSGLCQSLVVCRALPKQILGLGKAQVFGF